MSDATGATVLFWLLIVAVVAVALFACVMGWDRYHSERPKPGTDAGMRPTDEVFLDPVTGRRQRVWGNPATGAREYRDE